MFYMTDAYCGNQKHKMTLKRFFPTHPMMTNRGMNCSSSRSGKNDTKYETLKSSDLRPLYVLSMKVSRFMCLFYF